MYNHFFGFKERPFKLVPNPDYLFLSRSHEEALAHLNYAVTDGEGFVEIIGEIGTGKTMLCRTFLESLGEDTESAYIFNPRMDVPDLLKAVNDEFGIRSDHTSTKGLIDELNTFLMQKKAAGKKVILLIDEAQNLSRDVLEQIRLLSNLETTKDKLLQIILVGQPELGEMLDSYELRQLGQRISLSCRLHPLTYAETRQYIAHRIRVASKASATVFSKGAIRRIYQFSRGIPRLINMACDRALLTAYGRHQLRVSGSIAKAAILELVSRGEVRRKFLVKNTSKIFAVAGLCAVLLLGFIFYVNEGQNIFKLLNIHPSRAVSRQKTVSPQPAPPVVDRKVADPAEPETAAGSAESVRQPPQPETRAEKAAPAMAPDNQIADFKDFFIDKKKLFSKTAAVESLLNAWGIDKDIHEALNEIADDPAFFSLAAQQGGLVVTPVDDHLKRIVQLNVPAILRFDDPLSNTPVYLTLIRVTSDAMVFSGNNNAKPEIFIPYDRVLENWSGKAFVFWKNFYNYQNTIPIDAPGESIITLKLQLRDIGYQHIPINATYDLATEMAIKAIQAQHGIPIDGFVGPLTKIVLYNEKISLAIPHLWKEITIPENLTIDNKLSDRPDGAVSSTRLSG